MFIKDKAKVTAQKDDNVYLEKRQHYRTPNSTRQHLIVYTVVTNDKRLCWTFCVIEVS